MKMNLLVLLCLCLVLAFIPFSSANCANITPNKVINQVLKTVSESVAGTGLQYSTETSPHSIRKRINLRKTLTHLVEKSSATKVLYAETHAGVGLHSAEGEVSLGSWLVAMRLCCEKNLKCHMILSEQSSRRAFLRTVFEAAQAISGDKSTLDVVGHSDMASKIESKAAAAEAVFLNVDPWTYHERLDKATFEAIHTKVKASDKPWMETINAFAIKSRQMPAQTTATKSVKNAVIEAISPNYVIPNFVKVQVSYLALQKVFDGTIVGPFVIQKGKEVIALPFVVHGSVEKLLEYPYVVMNDDTLSSNEKLNLLEDFVPDETEEEDNLPSSGLENKATPPQKLNS